MALIETRNLTRIFRRGAEEIRALDSVSMKIDAGELVAITGPSGCGKSTLLHILGLLDRPTSGEYLVDGRPAQDISEAEASSLRNSRIGFVFQHFYLLPRVSALRNVGMPLVYSRQGLHHDDIIRMSRAALERVALGDRIQHDPSELSGGQRQRCAIARAIVNAPSIILADEPTGNLDSKSGREILALFRELNAGGTTIIIVTHDPYVAEQASRRVQMFDGHVVDQSGGSRDAIQ